MSIDVNVEKDAKGKVQAAQIRFGPHFAVSVKKSGESVTFALVATHHGFKADASKPSAELERLIEEVVRLHPETKFDGGSLLSS